MSDAQLDLPKGVVKRIIKEKLSGASDTGKDVQLNKEALLAFAESAKVFISYITAAANDVCKEKKRQTLTADDVFAALDELEFQELIPQLREAFEAYKQASREKKEKKAEITRKRKSAGQSTDAIDAAAADGVDAAADKAADQVGGKATAASTDERADDEDNVMHDADTAEAEEEGAEDDQ